ncbi:hypothetical protein G7Y89_g9643 [Cudoniella acicularis]|uniref:Heterokaryon incompatibility domain-containing protein n=1 Tax=Cudoniella acicularis TaxID=354080 RepID=A0A8H4RE95_9HELO|nr:hypothetical protein G7Y89_g9643 [Cudoniella acicularis]
MASANLYKPLDAAKSQIRLVQLLPDPTDHSIRCRLSTIDWDPNSERQYHDALSYEWGSPSSQREIIAEGQPFMIRENLWNALHQFRSMGICDPIWIDAICINQDDLEERNAQVNMMDMIYGSARCVRVWLGQEGQQSKAALNLLMKIYTFVDDMAAEACYRTLRPGATTDQIYLMRVEQHVAMREKLNVYEFFHTIPWEKNNGTVSTLRQRLRELLSTNDDAWLALALLFSRTYWSRSWIVQEYVLAKSKTIHCGKHILGAEYLEGKHLFGTEYFEIALAFILKLDIDRHPDINPLAKDSISRVQTSSGALIIKYAIPWLSTRRSLLELLVACKNSKASEPRDKIYALLGLAWDILHFDFKIDYSKPISEIKFDVIRSYISLNWQEDSRTEAAKLWIMLNETLPETLDPIARNEQEKIAQSIINQDLPVPPRVQYIQEILKQVVSGFTSFVRVFFALTLVIGHHPRAQARTSTKSTFVEGGWTILPEIAAMDSDAMKSQRWCTTNYEIELLITCKMEFRYQPLKSNHIRLLKPISSSSSSLSFEIIHVSLLSEPRYAALSYTWGPPGDTHKIRMNDLQFSIRQNLYDSLHQVQSSKLVDQYLWVDAICINQGKDDDALNERSVQITLMKQIYEQAAKFLVWGNQRMKPTIDWRFR